MNPLKGCSHMFIDPILQIFFSDRARLVEDNCDALGSTYQGRLTGAFGDLATLSFYPAHHITIGEGGFVAAKHERDGKILRSLRDWGRDCWCSGKASLNENGACGKRFGRWLEGIDEDIDHKYVYGEIGYNLKPIELQAAMGLEQLKKLDGFIHKRKVNFNRYYHFFKQYEEFFYLPQWDDRADPSWFAFPLTVKENAPFSRAEIVKHLEKHKVQTRNLFAGNILLHPAYRNTNHRVVGNLKNSNLVTTNTFFIGVYPEITNEMIGYVCEITKDFLNTR